MDQRRWLLPYIHGIDMQAITAVISQADAAGATLVTVALICMSTKSQKRGAHLRLIQQMKAFLEAMNNKALRLGLPLERHVVVTHNAVRSLKPLITELHCDAIVLVSRREQEIFLWPDSTSRYLLTLQGHWF